MPLNLDFSFVADLYRFLVASIAPDVKVSFSPHVKQQYKVLSMIISDQNNEAELL